jgi:hypothetical protein
MAMLIPARLIIPLIITLSGDLMAINPNIVLMGENPDIAGKLFNAFDRGRKLRAEDDALKNSNALTAYVKAKPKDVSMSDYMEQGGMGDKALEYRKAEAEIAKEQATAQGAGADAKRKMFEINGKGLQELIGRPDLSKPVVEQTIDSYYQNGVMDAPTYKRYKESLPSLPDDPEQLREHLKSQVMALMDAQKQMGFLTPDANAQLSANTSMRGQDVTMRGQDMTNSLGRDRLDVDAFNSASNREMQGKNFQDNLAVQRQKAAMTGTGKAASEDERKGAAWLSQADNAYKNMLSAMETYPGADSPGMWETIAPDALKGATQGTGRQLFTQAASSLSEALLRAATGAGVNRDEAIQKIREITPEYFDGAERRKQKLDSIPVYLESLKTRAGRAAPGDYEIPTPNNQIAPQGIDPKKYAKLVQGGVDPKEAEEFLREQGGQ